MSRSILWTVLLVLVVLAGCNGFPVGSDNPTVTPADVPTDSRPETPEGQLAPGVFPTRIDASALAHAHARVLGSTTFTIRMNRTYRYPNGTVRGWFSTKTSVDSEPSSQFRGYSRARYSQSYLRTNDYLSLSMYERWYTSNATYQRFTFANNTTDYRSVPPAGTNPFQITGAWRIVDTFSNVETQVTPLDRNGSTYYRIEGQVSSGSRFASNSSTNTSQWLLVDSRGVVREHHINATVTGQNGSPQRLQFSISYQNIGNTTVERPAWIDTARNRTNGTPIRS